jgi:hypothetical protein
MSVQLFSELDSIHKALSDIDKRLLVVATELAEALKPSHNNARDEICRCHFGSILVQLNSTGTVSKLQYCSMCGGKLSPVA